MTPIQLLNEIQKIDNGFSIVPNPNYQGLSNIFFQGKNYDLPPISSIYIPQEPDQNKVFTFPDGMTGRLYAVSEIIERLTKFIKDFKSGKYDGLY